MTMTTKHKLLTVVLAALIALFAAIATGCGGSDGGDDSSSSTAAQALTKVAFIKQAGAICDQADKRQAASYEEFKADNGEAKSKADEEKVVTEVGLPAIELEIEELREIGAPEGDEDEISAMIDEVEAAVEASKKDPLVVYKAKTPFKAPEDKAAKYGLKACGFT